MPDAPDLLVIKSRVMCLTNLTSAAFGAWDHKNQRVFKSYVCKGATVLKEKRLTLRRIKELWAPD